MQNLLENLNKEQLKAVTHKEGPLLIVAGAGTGKTTVVTQRIAYLIEQGLARSEEILALTFTEKAAGEMAERVDRLLPMGYLDIWISTFHSFGERILNEYGLEIGLPVSARLLNEFEQYLLVKKNFDKFDLDYYRPLGNPTKFIHALIRHFSRAKDEDISPAEYLKYAEELSENMDSMLSGSRQSTKSQKINPEKSLSSLGAHKSQILNITSADSGADKEILEQEIKRINEVAGAYHVYQRLLLDNSALDFGDLINFSLKLFRERPAILKKYQDQFKYILLDEFQDTNWAQYELIKILAAPKNNLTVVSDDDQAIYRFRGASMSNILQFRKDYPKAENIVLIKNYRNKQNILDLSYNFIQLNNPNRLEYALRGEQGANKLSKKLQAENKGEGAIKVIEGVDLQDEIRQVIEKVADIKTADKQATWNDFGILVRANESAKELCNFLEASRFPYIYFSSRGLYAKPVIMDVIAYLKLLDNYHESSAVFRLLSLPIFDFSDAEIMDFNFAARKKAWSLYTVLRSAKGKFGAATEKKINKFLRLIEKHTAEARRLSASEIIIAFLNDSGYIKATIKNKDEKTVRESTQYLDQFIKRTREFEAGSDEKNVRAFLTELNLEMESGEEGSIKPDMDSGPEAIKVMTVHGAKGLEFKYVFIINMVDLRFPTIRRREPILIPDPLVKEILPEGDIHLEEERRLFYVAITRAKEQVYFSWAADYGGARKKKPSRFLVEAGLIKEDYSNKTNSLNHKSQITNKFQILNKPKETYNYKLPAYFSYTQLAAFKNCPYQYRFSHILKVPRRSKHTFSFGQTMHNTLQKVFQITGEKRGPGQANLFDKGEDSKTKLKKINITWDEIKSIYEDSWIDEWYESEKQKCEYKKLGKDSLKVFYEKFKDNWPNTVGLEQGVNLKVSGYRIFGKIDRVDESANGEIIIVDYKTGKPKSKDKISAEDKEQLLIYQLAVEQAMEKKIANLQFYYLNDNSEINFIGKDKELRNMEEKILDRINAIKKAVEDNNFPAKPGPLCKFCDFNGICEFRKL